MIVYNNKYKSWINEDWVIGIVDSRNYVQVPLEKQIWTSV